jgi:hypothetical protein
MAEIVSLLRPGGRLLIIARAREENEEIAGPPWPLTRRNIDLFAEIGLKTLAIEDLPAGKGLSRHWRALFRR